MIPTIDYEIYMPVKEGEPLSFRFEEDFVEQNVRCIPMIARFKLDITGIKLKLSEWSRFNIDERRSLMENPCVSESEILGYRSSLEQLIIAKTGKGPTKMPPQDELPWADLEKIPAPLHEKAKEFNCEIKVVQWKALNNLQRFALIKLCRPGHENKNFPKAMNEFGLMK